MALRSLPEDISSGDRQKLAQLDDKIQLVRERILLYSSLLIYFLVEVNEHSNLPRIRLEH